MTVRLTVAQDLVRFPADQYRERDGVRQRLIPGCFATFGPGSVAAFDAGEHAVTAPVPSAPSWWDVPVPETSAPESTQRACEAAERDQKLYL